jgi:hypothetical protein
LAPITDTAGLDRPIPGEPEAEHRALLLRDAPVLDAIEVDDRKALLCVLYDALTEAGVRCVPASRRRLVLEKFEQKAPLPPSGLMDPELWFFITGDRMGNVRTDGTTFRLDTGQEFPVEDVSAAARAICGLPAASFVSGNTPPRPCAPVTPGVVERGDLAQVGLAELLAFERTTQRAVAG